MKKVLAVLMMLTLVFAFLPAGAAAEEPDPWNTVDLLAGQGNDIGDVKVWNDADTLYVRFISDGDCLLETHVAVADNLNDIPQTKKGNPIPGQFEYSDPHPCVNEYTYEIPLNSWGPDTELYIAAHAATGVAESMWVSSDGDESFTAYTGPGTDHYSCETGDPRTGTAVEAWQHDAWADVTAEFERGTWIWESFRVEDPICGTIVDFEETFDIPGEFTDGTLWVTADNGYEAFLNGTLLATDGLSGDWRNSNLTESYVTRDRGAWSSIEMVEWLQLGGNTLRFETANEYFNSDDDGNTSAGTVDSNPGGLIYQAEITYYADGETAWGDGERFVDRGNWGTYFTYTVCPAQYVLDITSVNGNTGYTHEFTIVYDPITGDISGTGDSDHAGTQTLSNFDYTLDDDGVLTYIAFRSDYDATSYYWFPAFYLNDDGTLKFVDGHGEDNVYDATGTWSLSYVCNGG